MEQILPSTERKMNGPDTAAMAPKKRSATGAKKFSERPVLAPSGKSVSKSPVITERTIATSILRVPDIGFFFGVNTIWFLPLL